MCMTRQASHVRLPPSTMRLAFVGAASLLLSVGLMVMVGLCGPSVVVPLFPAAAGWPPYFVPVRLSDVAVTGLAWLAVGIGGLGLVGAVLAGRPGWGPGPPGGVVWGG